MRKACLKAPCLSFEKKNIRLKTTQDVILVAGTELKKETSFNWTFVYNVNVICVSL
jgi:hypothetical protein